MWLPTREEGGSSSVESSFAAHGVRFVGKLARRGTREFLCWFGVARTMRELVDAAVASYVVEERLAVLLMKVFVGLRIVSCVG